MAKDDYFIIAHRILAYLYECFKAGEKPDADAFGPDALKINNGYWVNVMESLSNEGYVKGFNISETLAGSRNVVLVAPRITQKGIEFLQENSMMAKAKEFLRTIKETIPGI